MKKLLSYLPFHFLLFLILGICCQFYTNILQFEVATSFYALLFLMFLLWVFRKKLTFVFLLWTVFFLVGMMLVCIHDRRTYDAYFENHIATDDTSILRIRKVLKPGNYYRKYEAEVVLVNRQKTIGKVLLNIQKDTSLTMLKVDDRLLIKESFSFIQESSNPHQFNYKNYLVKQGIHRQVFVRPNQFLVLENGPNSLLGIIFRIRLKVQNSLKRFHFSDDEYAVMNALLLGQRQDISKELVSDYSKAGAIHILAVSGLHVGIILLILSSLLKPLERIKKGRFLKLLLMILFLWFFALLAGLSASVVRAVTMFTAVAIGQFLNKKNAIEYSLVFSMFVLLLCKPMFLFEVGFQLSYLAVFGIVWVQPQIYNLWNPKFTFINKAWQLITVSLAAQLAVLPLSLFYFHQFPGLFLISNLVIIPFLGAILIGGIVILLLATFSILPQFLADCYGFIITLLNDFIQFISRQEQFLLTDISFSSSLLIASYLLIGIGMQFFFKQNAKRLLYFLGIIVVFQSVMMYEKYEQQTKQEFVVFHKSRNSIFGQRIGEKMVVSHDLDSMSIEKQSLLKNYKVGEGVVIDVEKYQPNVYMYKNQQILVVDSLGIYQIRKLHNPIIVLKQSPRINLNRLISTLKPKQIIADGSNYKSMVVQWKETCIKTKTPFWSTRQNGAYILK